MKKVCIIITKLELGGAQKVALHIAKNLDKNKFETFVISGVGGTLDKKTSKDLRLIQIPTFLRQISPLNDLKTLFKIYQILKKEKPDIVHTHSSKAGILGRLAAKLAGVKSIFHTIHGYGFNETQKMPVKYLFVSIERFCCLFTTKLICVTYKDIEKGIKYHIAPREKFIVLRAGIDINFYKNYSPKENLREIFLQGKNTKVVTTIGPFKPQKNLKDFINAAKIINQKKPDVRFVVVGDGAGRGDLQAQIRELNLTDKVLLLGWRDDIAEILCASDIFAMTSLWEGLPCAIVEAACCAKPIVANGVDGVVEIVRDDKTGFLAKPYDYKHTAQKIIYLIENEKQAKEFGENAKKSIGQEFDINFVCVQHEKLYEGGL